MTTAVDTSVLLDFLNPTEPHHESATRSLLDAAALGPLVVCDVVRAELAGVFQSLAELHEFLDTAAVDSSSSSNEALFKAGSAWVDYARRRRPGMQCPECGAIHTLSCSNCGRALSPRQHVLADFLIGAHALLHADQLLTRDRGYYSTYFPELKLAP